MTEPTSRILVVDDDPDLRHLLTRFLLREGFEADGVEDGNGMDAWLAQHDADLIVLDLLLPGEDGLSLVRRLRRDSQVPIVMLSARGGDLGHRRSHAAG